MDDDDPDPNDVTAPIATDMPVVDVLDRFGRAGWAANHLAMTDARVKCGNCGAISAGASIEIGARHRTEGASDPQDMLYVFGFACPICGTKGVIVAGYGPASSDQDQGLVSALGDDRHAVDPVAANPN